jgi:hypothetical protein
MIIEVLSEDLKKCPPFLFCFCAVKSRFFSCPQFSDVILSHSAVFLNVFYFSPTHCSLSLIGTFCLKQYILHKEAIIKNNTFNLNEKTRLLASRRPLSLCCGKIFLIPTVPVELLLYTLMCVVPVISKKRRNFA